jgi:hypothetical protein
MGSIKETTMSIDTHLRASFASALLALFAPGSSALAQEHMHHGGHSMGAPPASQPAPASSAGHEDHQGHGASAAPTAEDAWSYAGRDNPKPIGRNRWVMVPGESGAMYRSAKDLTPDQRCKALLGNPRTIVDEATRAACGGENATPIPAAPVHTDHSQHR